MWQLYASFFFLMTFLTLFKQVWLIFGKKTTFHYMPTLWLLPYSLQSSTLQSGSYFHWFISLSRSCVLFSPWSQILSSFSPWNIFFPWIPKADFFLRLLPPDLSLPTNLYSIYHVVYFLDVKKYIYVFFENFRHSCIFIIVCYSFLFKTGPPIWPRMASNSQ